MSQAGRFEDAWRTIVADNPLPAVHGRVCYHPCEDSCNRGAARQRGLDPRGRAVPRRPRARAGLGGSSGRRRRRQARADRRRRPERALRRLSPRPPRATRSRSARPAPRPGGMMHFGIPAYRLPRDVLDARDQADRGARRRDRPRPPGRDLVARRKRGGSTRSSSPSARTSPSAVDIPARDAGTIIDAVALPARASPSGERAADRPPRRGLRRRQHRHGRRRAVAKRLGAEEAMIVYRRTREQMPAHAFEADEAERGGRQDQLAAHDQGVRRHRAAGRGHGARRRRAARSRPVGSRRSTPTPWCSRSARRPTPRSCARVPGIECRRRRHRHGVAADCMTGRPGLFAGGDMVPGDAQRHGRRRATARRPPAHIDA